MHFLRIALLVLWSFALLAILILGFRGYVLTGDMLHFSHTYIVGDPANKHTFQHHGISLSVCSDAGQISFSYTHDINDGQWDDGPPPPFLPGNHFWWHQLRLGPLRKIDHPTWHDRIGFSWEHQTRGYHPSGGDWCIEVPTWFILLLFLLPSLPIARRAYRRYRANSRLRHGRCPTCGYDLRATPTRCPECGHPSAADAPIGRPSRQSS